MNEKVEFPKYAVSISASTWRLRCSRQRRRQGAPDSAIHLNSRRG
jgi:hypothetical protein